MAAKAVPAEPVSKESQFQVSPSEAQKEHMRLQKKLRQIAKIEERIAAGDEVDRLQLDKVARKEELLAQTAEAERRRGEEQQAEMCLAGGAAVRHGGASLARKAPEDQSCPAAVR